MNKIDEIKKNLKELIIEVMEDESLSIDNIEDTTPFFGTDEAPGIIQDSLAILEIATRLGEEYDILPEDFDEEAFVDVNTLSALILEKISSQASSAS